MVAKIFTTPFAVNGDLQPVPNGSQVDGSVSYDRGFGADYDRQLGVDPQAKSISRENWNAVQHDITTALQEMQSGLGLPPFDLTFAAALPGAGYPRAAIVPRSDGAGYWQNQNVGASTSDPTVAGSGWVPLNVKGTFAQALTNVNVTLSPSNAAFHTLILTGALTGNVIITLPVWPGYAWLVDNRCTGAFTASVTIAAGVPVVVTAGPNPIYCDGANVKPGIALSQATETTQGIAKLSTSILALAGVDDSTIMTPFKTKQVLDATVSTDGIAGSHANLKLSATGASAPVTITADAVCVKSAAFAQKVLNNIALTASLAVSGVNGLDTGTSAVSTWYSVWVIWNGTTIASLLSLSATAPTMPVGYTHKARVGWVRSDATANKFPLAFRQAGRRVQYAIAAGTNLTAYPAMGSTTAILTASPIAWANFAPPTAASLNPQIIATPGTAPHAYAIIAPSAGASAFEALSATPSTASSSVATLIPEGANLFFTFFIPSGTGSGALSMTGWEDNL